MSFASNFNIGHALERANYPVRRIEMIERSIDATELIATLASTAVAPDELDAVAIQLENAGVITFANWSAETRNEGLLSPCMIMPSVMRAT